ncbi:DNA_ligase [Hexamita inflata]|uniref:DNA_ligase n=1 Tax=Hexamita inflata TaxID=28002 RepID=A0ABP1HMM5_9EUKA
MNSQYISCSFNEICEYWQKIEDTTKRLEKLEYLSKLMIRMNVEFPEDIEPLLLLISNQIREPWLGQSVMNIGEQQVKKAIQNNFQVEPSRMKQDLQTTGDIGQLAQNYKSKQPKMFVQTKQLTVQYILQQFQAIADTQGQNSTQDKIDIMRRLMQDGSDLECRYLARLLLGKNRLGFQRKTILFALSEYVCFLKMVASGKIEAFKAGDKIVDYVNAAWAVISRQQVSNRIIFIWSADEDEEDEEDLMEDTQIQLEDTSSIKSILDQLKNSIQQQNKKQQMKEYSLITMCSLLTPGCHLLPFSPITRTPQINCLKFLLFQLVQCSPRPYPLTLSSVRASLLCLRVSSSTTGLGSKSTTPNPSSRFSAGTTRTSRTSSRGLQTRRIWGLQTRLTTQLTANWFRLEWTGWRNSGISVRITNSFCSRSIYQIWEGQIQWNWTFKQGGAYSENNLLKTINSNSPPPLTQK